MNTIITIARQFGSGGRELGRRIAEALNIDYYDKEILKEIAKHTSLSEEYVHQITEGRRHTLYPITIGQTFMYANDYYIHQVQTVYEAQSDIITKLAQKSSCVIVGRCADYILRDLKPHRIFVYADLDARIKRCVARNKGAEALSEKDIKKHILHIDKERAKFYGDFTGETWGTFYNYDLCINTTNIVIKKVAPAITKLYE